MLRLRLTTDAQPRWKIGQPAHSTTGVASANSSHCSTVIETELRHEFAVPGRILIAIRNTGKASADACLEAARHVVQFGIVFRRRVARFQCHAALRATAGFVAHHFGMHGAGVFGGVRSGCGRRYGFQRHAALGAIARRGLANFRVHRTGVQRSGLRLCCGLRLQVCRRVCLEFVQAVLRTKIITFARVIGVKCVIVLQ